ncbi:MAG: hypothetical protein WBX00_04260 [Isosphaeraceae bacterium]
MGSPSIFTGSKFQAGVAGSRGGGTLARKRFHQLLFQFLLGERLSGGGVRQAEEQTHGLGDSIVHRDVPPAMDGCLDRALQILG